VSVRSIAPAKAASPVAREPGDTQDEAAAGGIAFAEVLARAGVGTSSGKHAQLGKVIAPEQDATAPADAPAQTQDAAPPMLLADPIAPEELTAAPAADEPSDLCVADLELGLAAPLAASALEPPTAEADPQRLAATAPEASMYDSIGSTPVPVPQRPTRERAEVPSSNSFADDLAAAPDDPPPDSPPDCAELDATRAALDPDRSRDAGVTDRASDPIAPELAIVLAPAIVEREPPMPEATEATADDEDTELRDATVPADGSPPETELAATIDAATANAGRQAPGGAREAVGIAAYRRAHGTVRSELRLDSTCVPSAASGATRAEPLRPAHDAAAARDPRAATRDVAVLAPSIATPTTAAAATAAVPLAIERSESNEAEPSSTVPIAGASTELTAPTPTLDTAAQIPGELASSSRAAHPANAPSSVREQSLTPNAPINIERIEDLHLAIERLRPIPRGGAVIEVHTPELGALRVEVSVEDGVVRVRIDSHDPRASAWMETEQAGLTAAARQAAPEASSVELELRHGDGDARGRQPQRGPAPDGAASRGAIAGGKPSGGDPVAVAHTRRGLVDVVV
jgi:hypothetical protein